MSDCSVENGKGLKFDEYREKVLKHPKSKLREIKEKYWCIVGVWHVQILMLMKKPARR